MGHVVAVFEKHAPERYTNETTGEVGYNQANSRPGISQRPGADGKPGTVVDSVDGKAASAEGMDGTVRMARDSGKDQGSRDETQVDLGRGAVFAIGDG